MSLFFLIYSPTKLVIWCLKQKGLQFLGISNMNAWEEMGAEHHQLKAEVATHPLYEQLLSAHVACLRVATPIDQLPHIDAQLSRSRDSYALNSAQFLSHHRSQELDNFLVGFIRNYVGGFLFLSFSYEFETNLFCGQAQYLVLLCSFKEQLHQHVRVHAVEAVMGCREIEHDLQSLTGNYIY